MIYKLFEVVFLKLMIFLFFNLSVKKNLYIIILCLKIILFYDSYTVNK